MDQTGNKSMGKVSHRWCSTVRLQLGTAWLDPKPKEDVSYRVPKIPGTVARVHCVPLLHKNHLYASWDITKGCRHHVQFLLLLPIHQTDYFYGRKSY